MAFVVALVAASALVLGVVQAQGSRSSDPKVVITVTGKAPHGATVTFGRSGNDYPGSFPLHEVLPYSTAYFDYYVHAKLKNGGSITCTVTIGKYKSVGHAKGGHHTCFARLKNAGGGVWRESPRAFSRSALRSRRSCARVPRTRLAGSR